MGSQKALILAVFMLSCGSAAACDVPDGAARLVKSLNDFDRGIRDLNLPRAKAEELSNKGRQQIIAMHIISRDMDCAAARGQLNNEDNFFRQRLIQQNEEIIQELRRNRR